MKYDESIVRTYWEKDVIIGDAGADIEEAR